MSGPYRRLWTASWRALWIAAALSACAPGSELPTLDAAEAARIRIEERLRGVWRLVSYIPDEALSPAMLLSLQADRIVIRFEDGRIRSETPGMSMDRAFRIADAKGSRFKLYIRDDTGLEYESLCEIDESDAIRFLTTTIPWRGQGTLQRELASHTHDDPL